MKRWNDPFPPTPQGFHERVEATLRGLEQENMKHRRYNKIAVIVAVALLALLAAAAAAVVIGSSRLREELNDAGATDMAGRVQDVHLTDSGDGFDFSIDEVVWEGDDLYLSYTASVPEDGETYLLGLMIPEINGERVDYGMGRYLNEPWACLALALGGDYPASLSFVLPVNEESRRLEIKDMYLSVQAAFFRANRPLEYLPNHEEVYNSDRMTWWNKGWIGKKVFSNADTLYYFDLDDDSTPVIDLSDFPEVLSLGESMDAPYVEFWFGDGEPELGITPAGVDSTGIATLMAERSVQLRLDKSMVSHDRYNGLEENTFRYKDMTFTIEHFEMNHFSLDAKIWVALDGGLPLDAEGEPDFSRCPDLGYVIDGKLVDSGSWGSILTMDDGTTAYCCELTAANTYLPIGDMQTLELVTLRLDEGASDLAVDEVIARLTPVLDTALAEEEDLAIATREAAANWQEGDADIIVWATVKGSYYHVDLECSGMRAARKWHIADAVNAGKKPCPACIGGPHAPAEWEEGEDISNFGD